MPSSDELPTNSISKDNDFDLMDLLMLLINDPACRFYPHHKKFQDKHASSVATYLPLTMSRKTYFTLKKKRVILNHHKFVPDNIVMLNIGRLPICNKQRCHESAHWRQMARLAIESLKLESILKVLHAKRDELDHGHVSERLVTLAESQQEFLETCGFHRDGSFCQSMEQHEDTDVLEIYVLEVTVEKRSQASESFKQKGHQLLREYMPEDQTIYVLAWIHQQIEYYEAKKRAIDMDLYSRRFAAVFSGAWRKSFSEDQTTFDVNGHDVKIAFTTSQ